jgi:hypothetical protein
VLCCVVLWCVVLCCVVLCYVMLRHVTLRCVALCCVVCCSVFCYSAFVFVFPFSVCVCMCEGLLSCLVLSRLVFSIRFKCTHSRLFLLLPSLVLAGFRSWSSSWRGLLFDVEKVNEWGIIKKGPENMQVSDISDDKYSSVVFSSFVLFCFSVVFLSFCLFEVFLSLVFLFHLIFCCL